jgi:uncharacterized lipoprotein YajG
MRTHKALIIVVILAALLLVTGCVAIAPNPKLDQSEAINRMRVGGMYLHLEGNDNAVTFRAPDQTSLGGPQ